MKQLIYLIVILLSLNLSFSNTNDKHYSIIKHSYKVYKAEHEDQKLEDVLNQKELFKEPLSFKDRSHLSEFFWVQVDISEHVQLLLDDQPLYLRSVAYPFMSLFHSEQGTIKEEKVGFFSKQRTRKSLIRFDGFKLNKSYLFEGKYLYLKIRRPDQYDTISKWYFSTVTESSENFLVDYYTWSDIKYLILRYIFTGVCFIAFLFTFIVFIRSGRKDYLFYSLYVLCLWIYLSGTSLRLYELWGGFNKFHRWFTGIIQVVINLCYVAFVSYYLETKKYYPLLNKAIKIVIIALTGIVVLCGMAYLTEIYQIHLYALDFQRLFMTVFAVCGMGYLLIYGKNKLSYFIVFGSLFYLTGALACLFLFELNYMIVGGVFEIIIFAFGLTYKFRQEQKEKTKLRREAYANKIKALRAQMNPHFMFNSLNSIQYLVAKNENEKANSYLTKFSRLMRSVLESTFDEKVLLVDEIKSIEAYLTLEGLRFDNSFEYEVTVDDSVDKFSVEIPLLIVQPFIENAIAHGLIKKEGKDKLVSIVFKSEENLLICVIEDNGIGRTAAKQKKPVGLSMKKSRGIDLVYNRLKMMFPDFNENEFIAIEDLQDQNNEPVGTKATIKFPMS